MHRHLPAGSRKEQEKYQKWLMGHAAAGVRL
jgi:hypothetical protein